MSTSARSIRFVFSSVLLMIVTAVASELFFIHQSLRLDEAQTLWQTNRYVPGILHVVGEDVHVPLYHLLMYVWQTLLGNGVETARVFSILFMFASIPLIITIGNRVYRSVRISIFAALLFCISPFMEWFANDIRMYTLLVFFTLLNQLCYLHIMENRKSRYWLGYAISAICGMYTHYYFAFVLLTQAVFYFAHIKAFPKGSFPRFAATAVAAVASLAPWLGYVYLLGQASNSEPLLIKPGIIDLFNIFTYYLFGEQSTPINSFIVALWPLIMLGWFFSLRRRDARTMQTSYLITSVIFPILLSFLISISFKSIYEPRYLIFTLPSFCLVVSAMLSSYPRALERIVKSLLVLAMLTTMAVMAYNPATPIKENYEEAAAYLAAHATPQDVIVASAPFTVYPIEYYYQGPSQIQTLPIWNQYVSGPIPGFDESKLPSEVQTISGDHQRLWLLLSYDQGYEKQIHDYFESHYQRLETQTLSDGMTLTLYQLRYDTTLSQ